MGPCGWSIRQNSKMAVRTITYNNYIAHSEPLLKELNLLKVENLFELKVLKFRFKLYHNTLPPYFNSYRSHLEKIVTPYIHCVHPKYKLTVGNFYMPPHTSITQLTSFIDYFTQKLSMLNTRENTFACGDFNINLLSITANEHHSSYLEGILNSGFLPTITLPTRLSKNSTLIDNIFINKHEKLRFAGILNNEISDHQIVVVDMDLVIPPNKTYYITVFSNSDQTKQNFKNDLESKNIYDMLNKEPNANPNENYLILQTEITVSMKTHLTKKVIKFNRKKHKRDPWMTYGILNSVNRKNLLYKKLMKINRDSLLFDTKKQAFNAYKSLLRRLINQAKNKYYSKQFDKNRRNGKKTWHTIDQALHRKIPKSTPDAIIIDNKLSTDRKDIADFFNIYFSTVCAPSEIDNSNMPTHSVYLSNPPNTTYQFEEIDNRTVLQYINNMKPSHCCGHDNISSNTLKLIANEVSPSLTLIINQSLSTGIFPDSLKAAKVIPIHKKDEKTIMSNYRPISKLPVLSKTIESVMHSQLMHYFSKNKLFSTQQYGFRPNRSTELAALELMDRNIDNMNKGRCPINIYVDLSKTFDSLDHKILLSKLKYYGLDDKAINLLRSYLSNRNQFVQLGNIKSNLHLISRGIPLGSVIGPLLTNATAKFDHVMYTDDTTLISTLENFGPTNNVKELEQNINDEICKVATWLQCNKLKLNVSKSKFMLFYKHPKIVPELNILVSGNPIDQVEDFNYLGISPIT